MSDAATSRGARAWILLCRVTVATATTTTAIASAVSFGNGHLLNGALCVVFLFAQPTLYRAMTYGL